MPAMYLICFRLIQELLLDILSVSSYFYKGFLCFLNTKGMSKAFLFLEDLRHFFHKITGIQCSRPTPRPTHELVFLSQPGWIKLNCTIHKDIALLFALLLVEHGNLLHDGRAWFLIHIIEVHHRVIRSRAHVHGFPCVAAVLSLFGEPLVR